MSDHLAIATVTATLRRMLQAAIVADVPDADARVTMVRPNDVDATRPAAPGVNIFMYQVSPNATWRNADLPTRSSAGRLAQRPQVALNLHYLISFYGEDGELLLAQRLLGSVVRTLHVQPQLTPRMIRETVQEPTYAYLNSADLAEQIERVKFTPGVFSLEELSKLWTVFFQTPYALSAVYEASVVLIEGTGTPARAMPVRQVSLQTRPFRTPQIDTVSPQSITAGRTMTILGHHLAAPDTSEPDASGIEVTIRAGPLSIPVQPVNDSRIEFALPADLPAGVMA